MRDYPSINDLLNNFITSKEIYKKFLKLTSTRECTNGYYVSLHEISPENKQINVKVLAKDEVMAVSKVYAKLILDSYLNNIIGILSDSEKSDIHKIHSLILLDIKLNENAAVGEIGFNDKNAKQVPLQSTMDYILKLTAFFR